MSPWHAFAQMVAAGGVLPGDTADIILMRSGLKGVDYDWRSAGRPRPALHKNHRLA